MSSRRKASVSYRRKNGLHFRRPGLETLESRACPAVLFDFGQGVLRVTGDDGPNEVEVFQPRDRVVEVVGDGERRTFEGVDEILIDLGGGDDRATSSKPKEIVVVPSKIKEVIDMGEGDDRVIIDDGGPGRGAGVNNTPLDVEIDLGTGADELIVQLQRHDRVELDLVAEDGGDKIWIGLLLPAVQKVREAAARINLDLAGGSLVDVRTENVDDVDLSIHASSAPEKPGGTINVYYHVITNSGIARGGDGEASLALDLALGDGNDDVNVEVARRHVDFLWNPARVAAAIDLGAGDDLLAIQTTDVSDLVLALDAGDGDDQTTVSAVSNRLYVGGLSIDAQLGAGDDALDIVGRGSADVSLNLDAGAGDDQGKIVLWVRDVSQVELDARMGAGNDSIWIDIAAPLGRGYPFTRDSKASGMVVDLGDGDDRLSIDCEGFTYMTTKIDAGSGDDVVEVRFRMFSLVDRSRLEFDAQLGAGDDTLRLLAIDIDEIMASIDGGEGDDTISTLFISKMRAARDRVPRG